MPRRIIIDTDPGQDDAVAILLALASKELDVVAVTAVAGNVPLSLTETNARKVLELAGRTGVPVYAGCPRPLVRSLVTAEHVHGKTGLDGPVLPDPVMPLQPGHAVDYIVRTLRAAEPGEITLCTLGPLTNIAAALVLAPDIAPNVRELVAMGGGYFEQGNITPSAEFNIYVDPHAADVVLRSGIPVTLLPLDVTHKVLCTAARVASIRALGTRCASAVADMIGFFERFDVTKYGSDGAPLHDPCVIAYLLQPDLFTGRHVNVEVELASPLTLGATVADWWGVSGRPANAQFMTGVDADGFFALLQQRLALLP